MAEKKPLTGLFRDQAGTPEGVERTPPERRR
jgi:hypothetical protein